MFIYNFSSGEDMEEDHEFEVILVHMDPVSPTKNSV